MRSEFEVRNIKSWYEDRLVDVVDPDVYRSIRERILTLEMVLDE